jgi:transposase
MERRDARSLAPSAQEAIRLKAVQAVLGQGLTQAEAAKTFGVSRQRVNGWCRRMREGGEAALASKKRGRPAGPALPPHIEAEIVGMILGKCPDQLRLPFALWTREAVVRLLAERCGKTVSVWTAGRYLRAWGFTPQKPLRRAYEQDPKAVAKWKREVYPAIAKEAKRLRATIFWGDEMGLRSDHQAGRSWSLRGLTPVVPGTGQRFGCNMVSVVSNRGVLAFMVFRERFTASVFIRFLNRLLRQFDGRLFLILDSHPVHRSAKARKWFALNHRRIRQFFLPAYSPQLNPDELLNNDVKTNSVGRRRAADIEELTSNVRNYLRSVQKRPSKVRSYFNHPDVRYAA